jgi:large subunit ribosomal protein L20
MPACRLWTGVVPFPQVKYSVLMHGLRQHNIQLNRKMLSELAMNEPYSFKALVDQVKFMQGMDTSPGSSTSSSRSQPPGLQ